MTIFTPLPGTYVAIRIDPRAMAEQFEDPVLLGALQKLSPKIYLGYVDQIVDFPWPDRPNHRCYIQFVGQGLPTRFPHDLMDEKMSAPILPNAEHPLSREALQTSPPFPFPDCYQYSLVECTVRIPTQDFEPDSFLVLPSRQIMLHDGYIAEDLNRLKAAEGNQRELSSEEMRIHSSPPTPHGDLDSDVSSLHGTQARHAVCEPEHSVPLRLRPCSPERDGVLEDAELDATGEEDSDHVGDDGSFVSSHHSTQSEGPASLSSSILAMGIPFMDRPVDDPDIIPIVYVSPDLSVVTEVHDPNEFLDEKEAIVKLIQESRLRQQRAFEATQANGFTDIKSPEGSWVDLETEQIDLDPCQKDGGLPRRRWYDVLYMSAAQTIRGSHRTRRIAQRVSRVARTVRRHLCLP